MKKIKGFGKREIKAFKKQMGMINELRELGLIKKPKFDIPYGPDIYKNQKKGIL
ncbi:MAG: hypothetical protein LBF71_00545 [Campylobacteraceae bacterium]|jgi:hypothetical protein|nr:hypothetical protein [Campylobacteraceae bacterium]